MSERVLSIRLKLYGSLDKEVFQVFQFEVTNFEHRGLRTSVRFDIGIFELRACLNFSFKLQIESF